MKTWLGTLLAVLIFVSVALAFESEYRTRFITSATLTIKVKDGQYLVIRNFTQDRDVGQRGVISAAVIPSTPTPTAAPTASPTPIPPYISTQAGPGVGASTTDTVQDTATLVGFNNPTGTISFTLVGPSPSNAVVDSEQVTVNGNANYQTPTGFDPTVAGTYTWSAQYSGDINNNPAIDNGNNETVVVTATPTPAPTAAATPTPINAVVLTAAVTSLSPKEFIKPIIVAGPATLTIPPVPPSTLAITYRKGLQPIQPTPTASATAAFGSTSSSFSTSTSVRTSTTTRSGTVRDSAISDDDEIEWSTPSPTPTATATPTPGSPTPTATPTPIAKSSVTPTPTPRR